MSYIGNQGEQSTSSEITALTNLTNLAASGSGQFLRKTGSLTFENSTPTEAGLGDVSGPSSSTDLHFASFNGTTGKIINDSGYSASDFLQNIVEDTTPQLGGNLNTQGYKILGGTATTSDLTLQTTSGVGTTGADIHFLVGNNGGTEAMTILNSGNVGINTNAPSAKLHLVDGSLLASGTTGATPVSGAGTRLMWIPAKAAFRAGTVSGTQWNDANIGTNSFAFGIDPIASGLSSIAIGDYTQATGDGAIGLYTNSVAGNASIGIGASKSDSPLSVAIGYLSEVISGFESGVAIGNMAMAWNYSTVAIGAIANASGNASLGLGYQSYAEGDYSVAIGSGAAIGDRSIAFSGATSNGDYSLGLSANTTSDSFGSISFGRYNVGGGTAGSWVATDPLFEVGNGTGSGAKANAFTVLKDGKIGLNGKSTPTAMLHLPAGTATASTAPLKFTSGTLLGTPEAGAMEFLTDDFYATITTGAARKKISLLPTDASFALTAAKTFTVSNTLTLTATDGSTLAIGTGGTLGTAAYTATTAYAAADHDATHAVGGADTVFPADPGADRYLMWDDDPGALVWSAAPAPEGTAVLSTGEAGGTKFLREDGDGTCSWQTLPAQVEDNITDGHTTIAPSGNAVFDALALKAPLTAPTFATSITGSYLTASEILITDGSKNIVSAPVATYPSLTELSYVKGLSSAIQTQLGGKASLTGAETLTNKRITQRVVTTTDDATAVIDIDACDVYELSAIANATEFTTTGTPTDGQKLLIRLKDAGVSKALTWTGFTAIGVTLPTATTAGKWHYIGCVYNLAATAWHVLAVGEQA